MSDHQEIYLKADGLVRSGDPTLAEEGLQLLKVICDSNPDNAQACFEYGGAFDTLGREAEAAKFYQRALTLGYERLSLPDQPRLFVQFGSTLRNLKKYDESKEILRRGIELFPRVPVLKTVLGLTEYSTANFRTAAKLFLHGSLPERENVVVKDYSPALRAYYDVLDTHPARQRYWMRSYTHDIAEPANIAEARIPQLADSKLLGELLDQSFRGTVDHKGESPQQCVEEISALIEGKYGPFIPEASYFSFAEGRASSASLVTLWKGLPLLAYSMTNPKDQGRGLGGFLILKSLFALKQLKYKALYLTVTEGNDAAEHLYRKLGFEVMATRPAPNES